MSKLVWDEQGKKLYENGVSKGVLYKLDKTTNKWKGVAWNGLTSVAENPEGADENELYADNIKYGSLRSAEKFGGTIEAYTYPEEFEGCDGMARPVKGVTIGQQKREIFCLAYRSEVGSDLDPEAGYKLHLVYNATCSPSDRTYETVNDSPDAITFSWDFETTPIPVTGYKATSRIVIDSMDFATAEEKALLTKLENVLYGTDAGDGVEGTDAELPLPDDLFKLLNGEDDDDEED